VRTSDALCRATVEGERAPTRVFVDPEGRPARAVQDGTRRTCCARVAAPVAGLGRQATSEPERLPLDCPKPFGAGGRTSRSLFTCTDTAPHPVVRRQRGPPRQRPVSHFGLSGRAWSRVASRAVRTRKMRLSNFCNRLSIRAPLDCPAPVLPCKRPCGPLCGNLGRASLDGDAPASALPRLPSQAPGAETPTPTERGPRAVLVELRS
jgi:hypothetical protein